MLFLTSSLDPTGRVVTPRYLPPIRQPEAIRGLVLQYYRPCKLAYRQEKEAIETDRTAADLKYHLEMLQPRREKAPEEWAGVARMQ